MGLQLQCAYYRLRTRAHRLGHLGEAYVFGVAEREAGLYATDPSPEQWAELHSTYEARMAASFTEEERTAWAEAIHLCELAQKS